MNFIVAQILKYTRKIRDDYKSLSYESNEEEKDLLVYDEIQAFYTLVYIMKIKEWREVYRPNLDRLIKDLLILEASLESSYPQIFKHIEINQCDSSLFPIFGSFLLSLFVSDLQDKYPKTLAHIFDAFLIDGEQLIFTLLIKFIDKKQEAILEKEDMELIYYMKSQMIYECLQENNMLDLLDYNYALQDLEIKMGTNKIIY